MFDTVTQAIESFLDSDNWCFGHQVMTMHIAVSNVKSNGLSRIQVCSVWAATGTFRYA